MKKIKTRRDFIRSAAYGAAGTLAASQLGLISCKGGTQKQAATADAAGAAEMPAPGIQLYTIRDAMQNDVRGTLEKVAQIGYKNLELAGYQDGEFYGFEPSIFKAMVEDLGMKVIGSHTGVEIKGVDLVNAEAVAEDHAQLGVKYCVKPWLVEERRVSVDSYKQVAEELNTIGEVMAKYDIQFGYHNHDFEFDTVEGQIPYYDILIPETEPELVAMEIDLYWTTKAGHDPVEIFNRFPGRFGLWHVKDMTETEDKYFAPVGTGVIDFERIFAAREKAGMKYFFVEQDSTRTYAPMEAIEISYDNLANKILA
jgi:sugar phosphate isomerase/epimerase